MEKKNRIVIVVCIIIITIILSGSVFYFIGSNAGFNRGTREAGIRETERIELIEEYERRESERNRVERERIERTEASIKSLESLSAGTRTEIQKLREIYSVLADEYNSFRNDYFNRNNSNSGNGE